MQLDVNKMSESEVSLRLALFIINNNLIKEDSEVEVALDGAQIKTGNTIHFPIEEFLKLNQCVKIDGNPSWRGLYQVDRHKLVIHSQSGVGDVVTKLRNGKVLRVESKKGPLVKSNSSQEYPLLREALGQLLTIDSYNESDILAVAVPYSIKFKELADKWRNAPLVEEIGIKFLLIHRTGEVEGLSPLGDA